MSGHVCDKDAAIAALTVTVDNIEEGLQEQRALLREFLAVLQRIAAQDEQIINLQATDKRHEDNFNSLFPRTNALEIKAEGINVKIGFIVAAASTITAALMKLWR